MHSLIHRACRASHTMGTTMRTIPALRSLVAAAAVPSYSLASTIVAPIALTSFTSIRHATTQARPHKQIQKRTFRGIYAGKHVHFGHQVSHSESKTRRTWLPNVQKKKFWSQVLGRELEIKVTMAALRTFDKYGGLDRYILRMPLHRLDQGYSRALRTTMELQLLNDPRIAQDLNLLDVIERLKRPSEVKRLRAAVLERQEWAKSTDHLAHPILKQRIPDGTVPELPPATEEELQARRAVRMNLQNGRYLARKAAQEAGLPEHIRNMTQNGIRLPKNKAQAAPWTGPRFQRATYGNPFTKPKGKPLIPQAQQQQTESSQA